MADSLRLALDFYRAPLRFPGLSDPTSPLPDDLDAIVRVANERVRDVDFVRGEAVRLGVSVEELTEAARFFVKQVFFAAATDHYRTLGLADSASHEEIQARYRQLIRLFHPDRDVDGADWDAVYAARLNEAYSVLRNAQQRRAYDSGRIHSRTSPTAGVRPGRPEMQRVRPEPRARIPEREELLDRIASTGLLARFPRLVPVLAMMVFAIGVVVWLAGGREHETIRLAANAVEAPAALQAASALVSRSLAPAESGALADGLREQWRASGRQLIAADSVGGAPGETAPAAAAATPEPAAAAVPPNPAPERKPDAKLAGDVGRSPRVPRAAGPAAVIERTPDRETVAAASRIESEPGLTQPPRAHPAPVAARPADRSPAPADEPMPAVVAQESSDGMAQIPGAPEPMHGAQVDVASADADASPVVQPTVPPQVAADPIPSAPAEMHAALAKDDEPPRMQTSRPAPPRNTGRAQPVQDIGNALGGIFSTFISAYEAGDLERFMALFAHDAQSNGRNGLAAIREDYASVFVSTIDRHLQLHRMNWRRANDAVHASGWLDVQLRTRDSGQPRRVVGFLRVRFEDRDGRLLIAQLDHEHGG